MANVQQDGVPQALRATSRGRVFGGAPGSDMQSCAFPQVCVTPSGRWLCAFRAAPTKAGMKGQRTLLTWSDDRGSAWREPFEPFAPQVVEGKPGLMRSAGITSLGGDRLIAAVCWVDHSDPETPFFNEETEGLLDTRVFTSLSDDAGATWSEPRLVDTSPYTDATPITGPILRLPDGELACQFELNKHYYAPEPWRHLPVMLFSQDGGATWPRHSVPAEDPSNRVFYWDQRPAVLPSGVACTERGEDAAPTEDPRGGGVLAASTSSGRVLNAFWTFDREKAEYLNIHATESTDGGRTWAPAWDTGVPGQASPPFGMADGSIALVYVDRTAAPVIKARASADGGHTFPKETEVVLHEAAQPQEQDKETVQDAWAEMEQFSLGLPNTAPLPGGGALVVYYAGPETDVTAIHWAVIR